MRALARPAEGAGMPCVPIAQRAQASHTPFAHLFSIDPTRLSTLLLCRPLHRSIRESRANDTYESADAFSYHPTTPPSPRERLAKPWSTFCSRTPRCSPRCCCCCSPRSRGRRWRRRCGCGEAAPPRGRPKWSTVGPQAAGGAAPPTFSRVTYASERRRGVDRCFGVCTRESRSARARGST